MTFSNQELANRWAKGIQKGKSHNMFIDGDVIYSYGYHWPLGLKRGNIALINTERYSSSTTQQEGCVWSAANTYGLNIKTCNPKEINNAINFPDDPIVLTKYKDIDDLDKILNALRTYCRTNGLKRFPRKKFEDQIKKMMFIANL